MFTLIKKEPTSEPISLDDIKLYCKIQHSEEDDLLSQLLQSARDCFERHINKSLVPKTYLCEVDEYDFDEHNTVELPFYPIKEIVSIKQIDDEGNEQTVTSFKEIGKAKKSIKLDTVLNYTFEIEFTAGYDKCPQGIKLLLQKQILDWYENRGNTTLNSQIRKELNKFITDGAF